MDHHAPSILPSLSHVIMGYKLDLHHYVQYAGQYKTTSMAHPQKKYKSLEIIIVIKTFSQLC